MEDTEEIKSVVRNAFADTGKGDGIGLREATALDNRADATELALARKSDTETHWWDIVEEWDGQFGTALSFTDKEGFKFLLPATMWSALDGSFLNLNSIQFHLCVCKKPYTAMPHHGHPAYTEYLRSLHPEEWVTYFDFSPLQVNAIALFLKWADSDRGRDHELELRKKSHQEYLKHALPGNYTLSFDDVVNNYDEERRILREWLELGKVPLQ